MECVKMSSVAVIVTRLHAQTHTHQHSYTYTYVYVYVDTHPHTHVSRAHRHTAYVMYTETKHVISRPLAISASLVLGLRVIS